MSERKIGKMPHAHVPTEKTRKMVADMYACGIPRERISKHLDICLDTMEKHYRNELDYSLDQLNSELAGSLALDALNGDKDARKFWLQTRARFAIARPVEEEKLDKANSLLEQLITRL